MHQDKTDTLALLREKIRRMEPAPPASVERLPTGFAAVDEHLGGGLARGCVHEIFSAGHDRIQAARPATFAAHALARTAGPVIWVSEEYPDLSAPGIRHSGLNPGRLLCVTTRKGGLEDLCEDVLNEVGVCALVADIRSAFTPGRLRQLVLAAGKSQVSAFLLYRASALAAEPPVSASMTRWRIGGRTTGSPAAWAAGAECWSVDLLRHRDGPGGTWSLAPSYQTGGYARLMAGEPDRRAWA